MNKQDMIEWRQKYLEAVNYLDSEIGKQPEKKEGFIKRWKNKIHNKRLERKKELDQRMNREKFEYTTFNPENLKTEPEGIDLTRKSKGLTKIRYWWYKRQHPEKLVISHLYLENGNKRSLLVKEDMQGFVYQKKFYIFDNVSKIWNVDSKFYEYEFYESLAIPINLLINDKKIKSEVVMPYKKDIPINDLVEAVNRTETANIVYAINPSNLNRWLRSSVIKELLQAGELEGFFNFIKIMLIIVLIIIVVHFLLFIQASGILKNLNIGV